MVTDGMSGKSAVAETSFKALGRQFVDFVLGPQLGSGGMGIVYEAMQISLNRKVALKFIRDSQVASPTLLRRFTIEAEATARLHHPNIVGIHEIGEIDGQPYFSMDLVEGESLRTRMTRGDLAIKAEAGSKSNGRSRQATVARMVATTARSLHHAHQRGVLHRDLKPANILLDQSDEPHLTDFGLAKILRQTTEKDTKQSLTGTGDIAGTPSYMSPEQASSSEVTSASDVYGLGAVMYELLTGRPPFRGNTALETIQQVQNETPRSPRSLNPLVEKNLETICLKCLEKEPARRYLTAEALAEDLENWIAHKPIKARPAGPVVRARQWMRRNHAGTALIVALFAGFATALVLLSIVSQQKKQFELQQSFLFAERVENLMTAWRDPARRSLLIAAKDLSILGNRTPLDSFNARHLTLGIAIREDPISFAQTSARYFAQLESSLRETLGEPVALDLIACKTEAILAGQMTTNGVDFTFMPAVDFLAARERNPGLTPFARRDSPLIGTIMANGNLSVRRLPDLAGQSIFFPPSDSVLTVWAKSRFVDEGLLGKDFSSISNLVNVTAEADPRRRGSPRSWSRILCAAVLNGQFGGGVTSQRRFDEHKDRSPGLTLLDRFEATPMIFVAKSNLETNLIAAFRAALLTVRMPQWEDLPEMSDDLNREEPFAGAVGDRRFLSRRTAHGIAQGGALRWSA